MAACNAAARDQDKREVSPIMAVPGETYLVEFNEKEGFIIDGKKGEKRFAQVFAFDLMSKEEISCYAQSDTKLEYVPAEERVGRSRLAASSVPAALKEKSMAPVVTNSPSLRKSRAACAFISSTRTPSRARMKLAQCWRPPIRSVRPIPRVASP
jgi:hypothetical protein